jgi:hypothetical protein
MQVSVPHERSSSKMDDAHPGRARPEARDEMIAKSFDAGESAQSA